MQPLFGNETKQNKDQPAKTFRGKWSTFILGFIGSAIILWIVLLALTPFIVNSWSLTWIGNVWTRTGIAVVLAVPIAGLLTRIEGTIWGRYYVIVGYLLSLGLIFWIVLRLLRYI